MFEIYQVQEIGGNLHFVKSVKGTIKFTRFQLMLKAGFCFLVPQLLFFEYSFSRRMYHI